MGIELELDGFEMYEAIIKFLLSTMGNTAEFTTEQIYSMATRYDLRKSVSETGNMVITVVAKPTAFSVN